jgi:DNA-binding response OmpR family regulator
MSEDLMKVLVAEDEQRIASLLAEGLSERGFDVQKVHRGDDALDLASREFFDALVLDVNMPGADGFTVVQQLRKRGVSSLILMLTARGDVPDRINGLEVGADDYMTKPFSVDEVAARLKAMGRRHQGVAAHICELGSVSINLLAREAQVAGQRIDLTAREFSLLECLMRSPGKAISRPQLTQTVWHYNFDPGTNIVDVYVKRLREKLGEAGNLIQTVRGVGYVMGA